ncbi:MAG: site-specific integrase [Bacteroidetes bacterium]|nr:site-specific integrase [Bacteroidota bacterium]
MLCVFEGKQIKKSTGIKVLPGEFDPVRQIYTGKCQITAKKIELLNHRAKEFEFKAFFEGNKISVQEFICYVLRINKSEDKTRFVTFFESTISTKNVSYVRLKSYKSFLENIKEFSPDIKLSEINYTFCTNFFSFLTYKKSNSQNTLVNKFKILKLTIGEAINHGLIEKSDIAKFKLKKEATNRKSLSESELIILESLYTSNTLKPHLQNTLRVFLFSCYTSLRFADIEKFTTNYIVEDAIKMPQNKTGKDVYIPLIAKAKALLPETKFKVLSNQKTNKNLLEIKNISGIKNEITFHIARHTFGTLAYNKGIELSIVSNTKPLTRS